MKDTEILALLNVHPETIDELDRSCRLHRLWQAPDQDALIAQIAPTTKAVVTNGMVGITGAMISQLPALEIIAVLGVGVDAVDIETARSRGVRVTNTPDVLTPGVAELALALMLDVGRRISANDRYLRAGRWVKEGDPPLSSSLLGRTLGIFGMGRIGQAIAERALVFGMDIAYGGPRRKPDLPYPYYPTPLELASAVDVLMVSCKGGPDTAGLIDRAVIEALGPKGWLINVARGSVVDEAALVDALVAQRLGAAGLDVFAREPHVPEALLALDNVVLQPHQGSGCHETRKAMGDLVLANIRAHFNRQPLVTPVV